MHRMQNCRCVHTVHCTVFQNRAKDVSDCLTVVNTSFNDFLLSALPHNTTNITNNLYNGINILYFLQEHHNKTNLHHSVQALFATQLL